MRDPHFVVYLPSAVHGYPLVHAEFLAVPSVGSLKGGPSDFLDAAVRVAGRQDLVPVLDVSGLAGNPAGAQGVPMLPSLALPGLDEGPVDSVFQALKVFVGGGPYLDLARASSEAVAGDARLTSSGALLGFFVPGAQSPALTCRRPDGGLFYAWLVLSALFPDPGVGWAQEAAGYMNLFAPPVDRNGVSLGWCVAAGVALLGRGHSLDVVLRDFDVFRRTVGGGRKVPEGGSENSRAA